MRSLYRSKKVDGLVAEISHEEKAIPVMQKFLKEVIVSSEIGLVVEIGTATGGWTLLAHEVEPNITILTFDIESIADSKKRQRVTPRQAIAVQRHLDKTDRVQRFIGNCFSGCNCQILNTVLKLSFAKLLYCDGGDKKREMLEFGPLLNSGDILGVHDWVTDVSHSDKIQSFLLPFRPLPINSEFVSAGGSSRFFMKR